MGVIRPMTVAGLVLAASAAGPAAAATTTPRDNLTSELDRAAFVALPAVYELRATVRINAIIVAARRITIGRDITVRGTAHGVAPARVVTALHLVRPSPERVLLELRARGIANLPPTAAGMRVVAQPVDRVELRRAGTETLAFDCDAGDVPPPIEANVLNVRSDVDDIQLLEVEGDVLSPTLALIDEQTRNTPIAIVGFGGQTSSVPVIRTGTILGRAQQGDNDRFGALDVDVVLGDSGAPVLDVRGRSHGVVIRRESGPTPAIIAGASAVRRLLEADGVANQEAPATARFRDAMAAFWARDYRLAERRLAAVSASFNDSALPRCEQRRAAALATDPYAISGPSRGRRAILAFGAIATLVAAILGVIRILRHPLM